MLGLIIVETGINMHTLDEVLNDVTAESTRLDSVSALISGLQTQLADALSGAALPPAVQTQIDSIFAGAEANKAKIDAALNLGVPAPNPAQLTTAAAAPTLATA